jgi:GWxTD domain-containing protein
MRRKILITLLMTCLAATVNINIGKSLQAAQKETQGKVKVKDLDKKYRDWLDLVLYIISPMEKNIFLKLTNNRDRDTFINLFWNLRDPTKGTPQNEFKDEHIKRFNYASHYFRGGPGPGWRSDRGKIYIVLGPPLNVNEVTKEGLMPVLIWEYFGTPENGLPTLFRIVFYKPGGAGDYKLYIPAVDGPLALLRTEIAKFDANDYYKIYQELMELSPEVAEVSLSLIPREGEEYYIPSFQDPILIGKIYDLPKRQINTTYARNFLSYKGLVETSVTTDYMNLKTDLYILKDPGLNLDFVHLALLPERISVDYSADVDKYYFNFNLLVVLKKGEDVVFQYNKDFPFYYSEEDLQKELAHGIIITDYFPVIEGKYRLVAVLQNSLNKEISYFERVINVGAETGSKPQVFGPLMTYQLNPPSQFAFSAFNIMGQVFKVDPQKTFGLKDSIYSAFFIDRGDYAKKVRVRLDVDCMDETRPYHKTYSFDVPTGKKFEVFTQQLEKLNYGNYILKVSILAEDDSVLGSRERAFVVSPLAAVPHPPFASKTMSTDNGFLFYTMVAQQYENVKNPGKAGFYYEKAYSLNQSYPQLLKLYASFLLEQKKYDKMLTVIENLKNREKELFDYYSLKGRAFYYSGMYADAVDTLLEANKIYDSDVTVLNTLGLSLVRIGEKEEAIKALSASLKIVDTQADIARLLKQLEEEVKNDKKKK